MIHVIGFNHHRCPISLREQVIFSQETFYKNGEEMKVMLNATDFILLNTCNRSEIIFYGPGVKCFDALLRWMATHSHLSTEILEKNMYHHTKLSAIEHIIKVCCGLDSMLLGEQQIFGQFKQAVKQGRALGFVGNQLYAICQKIYEACKHIRHATKIHQSTVSLAYAINKLILSHIQNNNQIRTLMVGTGETIDLILSQYVNYNHGPTFIAGRTIEKAKRISAQYDLNALRIQSIPEQIKDIDVVITATTSQLPIIGKGLIEKALASNKNKKLLIFDLAVPRDVESEVGDISQCQLYNIDDLQSILMKGQQHRQSAAKEANAMVVYEANLIYENICHKGKMEHIIQFRQAVQDAQATAITKALKQLDQGAAPEEVIVNSIRQLTNQFLHKPTTQLKQAIIDQDQNVLEASKYLFQTDDV